MRGFGNIRLFIYNCGSGSFYHVVHYNYFRPHEALNNKTPSEMAGVRFPYRNWLDIIKGKQKESWQPSEEELEYYYNLARGSPKETRTRKRVRRKKMRRKRIPAKSIMLIERGL